ncbi:SAM-dependent methyltransferase [Nocardioides marmorisolisilvae]|uniref:Class I SAM-dependent methyltransferase n=1 Tax=Nocardioides marmorisolisilvae TaxID=1542737 RepID=A0A3N0DWL3_9ACTN|nr:cyclopropane-fatty-acyl-phospholipid synthase family protein [Nocardioides marmorisolisilvae]RNL79941.1 class I SAM-dependent methyltransferase [Nocardioides marmorisolisilvae]
MTSSIDATPLSVDHWSDITPIRRGPKARISVAIARQIFFKGTSRLGISVSTDGSPADLRLIRPDEFFARLGQDGLIGFGEAYMTGAWEADDLGGTLTVLCNEIGDLVPMWMQRLRAVYVSRPPRRQRNSAKNTRKNIAHHYDLSNDLFGLFLDSTMSYSSAMFDTDSVTTGQHTLMSAPVVGSDLVAAQGRKIESILDAAGVTAGTRVLEIGTGWGELAIRAARRGATVRSVTLSSEQQALARARFADAVAAEGLRADAVQVDLLDYRAVEGQYDAVVSVEMIEAVGYEYLDSYFRTIDAVLAPGGKVAIQAITMPHERMLATRRTWTWIHKYIFPGGFLPSTELLDEVTRKNTALRLEHRTTFGSHYAETLRQWDTAFRAAHEQVLDLGFDETFERLWHFYLEYSRAGFASGYIDVQQLTFTREES